MNNANQNLLNTEQIFEEFTVEEQLKFNFNARFSRFLKKRRRELGWTQDDLAKKSGVNRVTIAKLENFQRTASVEVILKLLYALNVSIQFVENDNKQCLYEM